MYVINFLTYELIYIKRKYFLICLLFIIIITVIYINKYLKHVKLYLYQILHLILMKEPLIVNMNLKIL